MIDPFVGTILYWPVPWTPPGWLRCNGEMLNIVEYQMLYSLIGTIYGGDGRVNFRLPDMRYCVPVGAEQMGGGTGYLGNMGGWPVTNVELDVAHMPSHTHEMSAASVTIPAENIATNIKVSTEVGERGEAANNDYLAAPESSGRDVILYRSTITEGKTADIKGPTVNISAKSAPMDAEIGKTGGGEPLSISRMQPYITLNYIIDCKGIYPTRP